MLLHELAERSSVSVASIKYYRREGLLPPGERITATRQSYDRRHLDRLGLIGVLREVAHASIADIHTLVEVIDDPARPLIDALELAQSIASGLPAVTHAEPVPADEDPRVGSLIAALGWPDVGSAPRAALNDLLASMAAADIPADSDVLLRYGRPLAEIAHGDIEAMTRAPDPLQQPAGPDVGSPAAPSPDVMVQRVVVGTASYGRLVTVLRALGHASLSVARSRPDHGPPSGREH